jgi:hypothetical protein
VILARIAENCDPTLLQQSATVDEVTAVGGGRRTGDDWKVVRDLQEGSRRPLADMVLDVEPALRADGGDVTRR